MKRMKLIRAHNRMNLIMRRMAKQTVHLLRNSSNATTVHTKVQLRFSSSIILYAHILETLHMFVLFAFMNAVGIVIIMNI